MYAALLRLQAHLGWQRRHAVDVRRRGGAGERRAGAHVAQNCEVAGLDGTAPRKDEIVGGRLRRDRASDVTCQKRSPARASTRWEGVPNPQAFNPQDLSPLPDRTRPRPRTRARCTVCQTFTSPHAARTTRTCACRNSYMRVCMCDSRSADARLTLSCTPPVGMRRHVPVGMHPAPQPSTLPACVAGHGCMHRAACGIVSATGPHSAAERGRGLLLPVRLGREAFS